MLSYFVSGPSVPPLPPNGCYGGLYISSVVSEGLGAEAAEAAKAAAEGLGERPVKVLLPWYPSHPGIATFDQTQPAKLPVVEEQAQVQHTLQPQQLTQQLLHLQQLQQLRQLQLTRQHQQPPEHAPGFCAPLMLPPPGVPRPAYVCSR